MTQSHFGDPSGTADAAGAEQPQRANREDLYAFVTGGGYAMLLLVGLLVGLIGAFEFTRDVGPVPVGALVAVAVNFVMCWLGGRGMGTKIGAVAPAVGWVISAMMLSVTPAAGDVVVTLSLPGLIFLIGGSIAAAIGVVVTPSAQLAALAAAQRASSVPPGYPTDGGGQTSPEHSPYGQGERHGSDHGRLGDDPPTDPPGDSPQGPQG